MSKDAFYEVVRKQWIVGFEHSMRSRSDVRPVATHAKLLTAPVTVRQRASRSKLFGGSLLKLMGTQATEVEDEHT